MSEYYEQEVRSAANCSYSNGRLTLQHWLVTAAEVTATLDSDMYDFHFARKNKRQVITVRVSFYFLLKGIKINFLFFIIIYLYVY